MRRCLQGLQQWQRTCGSRRLLRRWSTMIGPAPISASTPVRPGPTSIKLSPIRCASAVGPGSQNNFSTSPSDGIFGFHAGAQWQWGAWVLGAEAALSGCFKECRSTSGVASVLTGFAANTFFEHKITNLFTVGPRLGYAWDRFMIFATGGCASAELKTAVCSQVTGLCDQVNLARFNGQSRNNGWYAGGGFDYMVHKGPLVDVILGLEYQHFDVGQKCVLLQPGCNPRPMGLGPERQGRHRACSPDHQDPGLTGSTTADRFQKTNHATAPGNRPGPFSLRPRAQTNRDKPDGRASRTSVECMILKAPDLSDEIRQMLPARARFT